MQNDKRLRKRYDGVTTRHFRRAPRKETLNKTASGELAWGTDSQQQTRLPRYINGWELSATGVWLETH